MQISYLKINTYKCLKNFKIEFFSPDKNSSTILIGDNGSGKSTILEIIIEIVTLFQKGSSDKKITYDFTIKYLCNNKKISIVKNSNSYKIYVNDECIIDDSYINARKKIMDLDFKIFPNKIIYLYNGDNDKNKNRINKILGQYKKDCNLILNSNDQIDLDSLPLNIYRIDKKMIPVCLLAILIVENSVYTVKKVLSLNKFTLVYAEVFKE